MEMKIEIETSLTSFVMAITSSVAQNQVMVIVNDQWPMMTNENMHVLFWVLQLYAHQACNIMPTTKLARPKSKNIGQLNHPQHLGNTTFDR